MIHSGKIEEGHELSNEELLKLGNDNVWLAYFINFSRLHRYLFSSFSRVFFRKEPKLMLNKCSSSITSTSEESAISLNRKSKGQETLTNDFSSWRSMEWINQKHGYRIILILPKNINPVLLFNFHITIVK